MAEAKWCGHDSRGRHIRHDDLPEIAKEFETFRSGRALRRSRLGFAVAMNEIKNFVLAPRYYDPERGQDGQFFTPKNAGSLLVHITRPLCNLLVVLFADAVLRINLYFPVR